MPEKLGLFKKIVEPIVPVKGTSVDAFFILVFFLLLFSGILVAVFGGNIVIPLFLTGKKIKFHARRIVQIFSLFFLIFFFPECVCVIREVVFGVQMIGRDNLIAFSRLSVAFLLVGVTMLSGRVFCGYICPLGFVLEQVGKLDSLKQRVFRTGAGLIRFDYILLTAWLTVTGFLAYRTRPDARYFSEYVTALWAMLLLVVLYFVVRKRKEARRFIVLRKLALIIWFPLVILGVYVTNPWCLPYGNELDYASLVSFVAVILASSVVALSWCRYMCPLGSLISLISPHALLRRSDKPDPGFHEEECPMEAIENRRVDLSSCILCGKCCSARGLKFKIK